MLLTDRFEREADGHSNTLLDKNTLEYLISNARIMGGLAWLYLAKNERQPSVRRPLLIRLLCNVTTKNDLQLLYRRLTLCIQQVLLSTFCKILDSKIQVRTTPLKVILE